LWKGQKSAVTVSKGTVEGINVAKTSLITLEAWGNEYAFEKDLVYLK
jgi:hypothetical protein